MGEWGVERKKFYPLGSIAGLCPYGEERLLSRWLVADRSFSQSREKQLAIPQGLQMCGKIKKSYKSLIFFDISSSFSKNC